MGFICGDEQLWVKVVINYVEGKTFGVKRRPLRFRLLEEVARLSTLVEKKATTDVSSAAVAYRGGVFKTPEIPKALQNRTKLNPIVKTVKNCCI